MVSHSKSTTKMMFMVCPLRSKKGGRRSDLNKLRFASWNIKTLTGKSIELVKFFIGVRSV